MRSRALLAPSLAMLATLVFAAAASAGGWAKATLDAPVKPPSAGQPFEVGFTLYQHGVTPVNSGNVVVTTTGPDGQQLSFAARRSGGQAHWTATVTLPSVGAWQWAITLPNQLVVEPETFGTLRVTATPGPVAQPAPLILLALVVLAAMLLAMWRRSEFRTIPLPGRQAQRS